MIVLDTSALSAAFRRGKAAGEIAGVAATIRRMVAEDAPLGIPGIVLQELLSGVRSAEQFARLERGLSGFPVLDAVREDHVAAARLSNRCRRAGISASAIDCLIAALTLSVRGELLTLDNDFARMAPHCGLRLFQK
ncbi:MAG: type II toxin-antitoxin system VapC family toxin [Thermoanaerobaculia bacterium]